MSVRVCRVIRRTPKSALPAHLQKNAGQWLSRWNRKWWPSRANMKPKSLWQKLRFRKRLPLHSAMATFERHRHLAAAPDSSSRNRRRVAAPWIQCDPRLRLLFVTKMPAALSRSELVLFQLNRNAWFPVQEAQQHFTTLPAMPSVVCDKNSSRPCGTSLSPCECTSPDMPMRWF